MVSPVQSRPEFEELSPWDSCKPYNDPVFPHEGQRIAKLGTNLYLRTQFTNLQYFCFLDREMEKYCLPEQLKLEID
jgi:hypothetical protein